MGITFDSDFQKNDVISNMSEKSIICHQCIIDIQKKVKAESKSWWIVIKLCKWQQMLPLENFCKITDC